MASGGDYLSDHNYFRQNPEESHEATANVEGVMDIDYENLSSAEQVLSEVEPSNFVVVASNKITSVKPEDSSPTSRLQIVSVVNINIASTVHQSTTRGSSGEAQLNEQEKILEIDIKVEPEDTDDPLRTPQVEAVPEEEALGLCSTWDVPLDIVKEESEDEDEGVVKRPQPGTHKHHEDVITRGQLKRNVRTKENTEEHKSKTNSIIEDKPDEGNNIVETCDKIDRTIEIDTHKKLKPFKCDTCQKYFSSKSSLYKHVRRIHIGERPYKCHVCKKCFKQKDSLYTHLRFHTGEKPYECNVCQKCFKRKAYLDIHIRTHTGEKPYECNVCKKCFLTRSELNTHIRSHTGDKPYECYICKKCFTQRGHLDCHIRIHTGEKPYECNVCKKGFIKNYDLKKHIRLHTGEKPYVCSVCEKRFPQKYQLASHFRLHTGEKPFQCNLCMKRFVHKSGLVLHISTHTGEKPYECNICKKCFMQKGHLNRHLRTHTGVNPNE